MGEPVRIDKWLWAARFFKTRSKARDAIQGGKVQLNGTRVKPGRPLKPGDQLDIRRGDDEFRVEVVEITSRRGPAGTARTLYREDEKSRREREARAEQRRLHRQAAGPRERRPSKRDRRQIVRFRNNSD